MNISPIGLGRPNFTLNVIERIWLIMKAGWFNNYVCRNVDQHIERLDKAILASFITDPAPMYYTLSYLDFPTYSHPRANKDMVFNYCFMINTARSNHDMAAN